MTVTIKDVASRAGVSTATVSRVLSDSPKVLPATRQRVVEAMTELDYRPSAVARSLRSKSTAVVGLIVSNIVNPFYPEVVRGVEDAMRRQGRSLLLCNAGESEELETEYLDLLLERRVDAVMVASGSLARRHHRRLVEFTRPVVLLNVAPQDDRLCAVLSDNHAGGVIAAQHLLACGYGQVVYVTGDAESVHGSERLDGVFEGAGGTSVHVVEGGGDLEGAAEATRHIAGRLEPPYGIAAHNDLTAVAVLSVLRDLGVSVPDAVGVVGFDDIALSAFVTPALTTVAQDKYRMGAEAAQTVDALLGGGEPRGILRLPVELVRRESTRTIGP